MRNKFFIPLAALVALTIGACQKQSKHEVLDFNSLSQQKGPDQDKAETIALAAEKLVYSDGFMYAHIGFDMALQLDPKNARSKFYKAVLSVAEVNKGGLKRIDPVIYKLPVSSQQDYQSFIENFPQSHTKDFLLDGQANISSEHDIQNHVRAIQEALRNVRTTLTDLRDNSQGFVAHVRVPIPEAKPEDILKQCPVIQTKEKVFELTECPLFLETNVSLNWADFEASKIVLAGYIIYMSQATAYDLQGAENVIHKLARYRNVTEKMVIQAVKQEPQLGLLADVKVLQEIVSMGAEGIEAVKYARTQQTELCPTGAPSNGNRPGHLFIEGFCIEKEVLGALDAAELAMKGPQGVNLQNNYWTVIDASRPLNGSITDLKSQLPNRFDRCGQATSVPDATLGGTFPRNDGVEIFRLGTSDFLNRPCEM